MSAKSFAQARNCLGILCGAIACGLALVIPAIPAGAADRQCEAWQGANAAQVGWSQEALDKAGMAAEAAGSEALLVIVDGKVVYSQGRVDEPIYIASVRKSILDGLFGVASTLGVVDLDRSIADLGLEDNVPLTEAEKTATLKDLLEARSGIYLPAAAESATMKERRPARSQHAPGTHFYYNNWDFNAAGEAFERLTSKSIFTALKAKLADPLCFEDFDVFEHTWYVYDSEHPRFPAYHMALSARDLARFGQLYLDRGRWGDRQILPTEWVERSTSRISDNPFDDGLGDFYGRYWWIAGDGVPNALQGAFTASGSFGQQMTVLPQLDAIIVTRTRPPGEGIPRSKLGNFEEWQDILEIATGNAVPTKRGANR